MKKEIILASGSPRRRELLNQIGIEAAEKSGATVFVVRGFA